VAGSSVLGKLRSVLQVGEAKREKALPENESTEVVRIIALRRERREVVREMQM